MACSSHKMGPNWINGAGAPPLELRSGGKRVRRLQCSQQRTFGRAGARRRFRVRQSRDCRFQPRCPARCAPRRPTWRRDERRGANPRPPQGRARPAAEPLGEGRPRRAISAMAGSSGTCSREGRLPQLRRAPASQATRPDRTKAKVLLESLSNGSLARSAGPAQDARSGKPLHGVRLPDARGQAAPRDDLRRSRVPFGTPTQALP